MTRPVLFVLAGVNGAGKSSIGGHLIRRQGLDWFNPDTFARELKALTGCTQQQANALAWQEGVRRLDQALAAGEHHALETTLGGNTLPQRILAATRTHDVLIWFCGLTSPALHRERVLARVAVGGHDIPEDKIRARFDSARANLLGVPGCWLSTRILGTPLRGTCAIPLHVCYRQCAVTSATCPWEKSPNWKMAV